MYNCRTRWYTIVDEMSVDEMSVDELSWNPGKAPKMVPARLSYPEVGLVLGETLQIHVNSTQVFNLMLGLFSGADHSQYYR